MMDPSEVTVANDTKPVLHKCPKCDRTFGYIGHMKCHFYRVHPEFKLAEFEVPDIGKPKIEKVGKVKPAMKKDKQEPEKEPEVKPPDTPVVEQIPLSKIQQMLFKCEKCSKCFTKKSSLLKHCITMHSDERSFNCLTCNKSFPTAFRLKSHEQTHRKKGPCVKCLKETFRRKEHYRMHSDKPYSCEECGTTFQQRRYLNVNHNRSHEGAKYTCDVCDKTFTRQCNLARHAVTHQLDEEES